MITRDSIEAAYCFFHQKERVYAYSTMPSQRDDIEYIISSYSESMSSELYETLAKDRGDYLRNHATFHSDMKDALLQLDMMMER